MSFEPVPMNQEQIDDFLHDVRNAVLATIRKDGSPQLTSVWYLYDSGLIYIGFDGSSAKRYNIERDPRVSICFDGGNSDSRTVTIYGSAEFVDTQSAIYTYIRKKMDLHYSNSETGDEGMMVSIRPEKILALDYND